MKGDIFVMDAKKSDEELKLPPRFTEVSFEHDLEEISDDDELVLIQAPVNFSFNNVDLNNFRLKGHLKNIKNSSEICYNTTYNEDKASQFSSYTVLVPNAESGKLKPIFKKISGFLTVTEKIDIPECDLPEVSDHHISFPTNLKTSYVPFGSGEYLKSPKKSKMMNDEEEEMKSPKKSNKKKRSEGKKMKSPKKQKHEEDDQLRSPKKRKHEEDEQLQSPKKWKHEEDEQLRSSKKRKREEDEQLISPKKSKKLKVEVEEEEVEQMESPKKSKRRKPEEDEQMKSPKKTQVWSIKEELISPKKIKTERLESDESSIETKEKPKKSRSSVTKNKKSKHKHDRNNDSEDE
ncbi:hypothetical protein CHUAL_013518 [Chamberlinius hualienensis]